MSSSGHLIGSGAGGFIDRSECVIRMNAAPTLNFERDVGKRTTFRVVGHRNYPVMLTNNKDKERYLVNSTTKSESLVVLWLYPVNLKGVRLLKTVSKMAKNYKNVTFYAATQKVMDRNMRLFYEELGVPR